MIRRATRRVRRALCLGVLILGGGCGGGDRSGIVTGDASDALDLTEGADTQVDASPVDTAGADTAGPDTDGADTAVADTADDDGADTSAALLALGDLCPDHDACHSGLCAPARDGQRCVGLCEDDGSCPEGSFCGELQGPKTQVSACLPEDTTACAPCRADADCAPHGEPAGCVSLGAIGSFCLLACPNAACAGDDVCEAGHCRPAGGVCDCSIHATSSAAETDCYFENSDGVCDGTRSCGDGGLSYCNASSPTPESCDGADEDCDGETDEDTCDDADPCTSDSCGGAAGCSHAPLTGGSCDDQSACTEDDRCGAEGCGGALIDCDDEDPCTTDGCDPATGCTHVAASDGSCDDLDACTEGDSCGAEGCAGTVRDCDDDDPCTTDGCDPASGCTHTPVAGGSCDDQSACTEGDSCGAEGCAGTSIDCDDEDPCTADDCDPATGCTHAAVTSGSCDDQDACTADDSCGAAGCGGALIDCDDEDPCTIDSCDPASGCEHAPTTGPACDDGNACTGDGQCFGGFCVPGTTIDCDDDNACTSLACDPASGCSYAPLAGSCDDGDPCTTGDACAAGECEGSGTNSCEDDNPCTSDQCIPGFGCVNAATGGSCQDADPCTFDEACIGTTCTPQTTVACDDGNPCTGDSCTSDRGCAHVDVGLSCVDDPGYQEFCEQVGALEVTEPNDSFGAAVLAKSGQTYVSDIDPVDDADRFELWTCGERIVRVNLDNLPATASLVDYELSFYLSSQSRRHVLRDSDGGNDTTRLEMYAYVGQAGPVYVGVDDFLHDDADAEHPYRLTLEALPVPDAALEPNDHLQTATAVASGETVEAYVASLDDHDWYAIEVPGERVVNARLTTAAVDGTRTDYELVFRNDTGGTLLTWRDSDGGNGATTLDVNYYVGDATTLYVDVHDFLDNDWDYELPYTLRLEVLPVPDAALEPNGNSNFTGNALLATPVADGASQAACIASVEDEDWFALDVPGEAIVNVVVSNAPATTSPVDYEVAVYGPSGNQLNLVRDSNGANGTTVIEYNSYAAGAGKYYVKVTDFLDDEWDIARCYTVKATILAVPDGADEPNDLASLALPLPPGSERGAYLASLSDVDWFTFEVPGERIVEVFLTMAVGAADPEVTLYQAASVMSLRDSDGGNDISSLRGAAYAPAAATYTLRVHDFLDDDWGYAQPYTVRVALHDVPDAALEPNDSRATATPVSVGSPVGGYVASLDDDDYWSFTAPASGAVTIQVKTALASAVDYEIILYDASGTSLQTERDSNGGDGPSTVTLSRTVTPGAAYTFRVRDFLDDDYDLAIPYTATVSAGP